MKKLVLFGVAFFAMTFSTHAQNVDCGTAVSTYALQYCAGLELEKADAELNQTYSRASSAARRLDSEFQSGPVPIKELLLQAQRAWIPFRDAACDAEASLAQGGTGQSLFYLECKTRITRQRTQDLLRFLDR